MEKTTRSHLLGRKLFCWICGKIYRIELRGRENLKAFRLHLKTGSAILGFNHLTLDDTAPLLALLLSEAGEEIREIVVPGSRKHWGNPVLGSIMRCALIIGLKVSPVVQHYEREGVYSPEHTISLDRRFVKAAHWIMATDGGLLLLAPEGHRSEDGWLQRPQKGVEFLLRLIGRENFNTRLMPIGIEPQEGFSRGINFGRKFTIHFGSPLTAGKIEELASEFRISPARVIMWEITSLLPARLTEGTRRAIK